MNEQINCIHCAVNRTLGSGFSKRVIVVVVVVAVVVQVIYRVLICNWSRPQG